MPVGAVGTQRAAATRAVTVDSLMRAGGQRYESTPHGRQDAYTSVIASKGKLYNVLIGFGRPASLTPLAKGSEKSALTNVVENASRDGRMTRMEKPLTAAQIKNCKRVDVSAPGRADQNRTLYIDKKTNDMYLQVSSWGRNTWSKVGPTDSGATASAAGGRGSVGGGSAGGRGSAGVGRGGGGRPS